MVFRLPCRRACAYRIDLLAHKMSTLWQALSPERLVCPAVEILEYDVRSMRALWREPR
jgi:hypothetical protein